ncbi:MAG: MaoC family dehydratase N-terminal domain-containing protein, partial [Dehalococcoidales bacterium]
MLLPDGKITPEGIKDLKKRIGVPLRIKLYNEEASIDAIRHFAHGIGDPNEMWDNPGHGFQSTYGCLVAPPTFLYSVVWPSGILAGGLPGVHSFFGGNDWEFFHTIRAGDKISAEAKLTDVVEKFN